MPRTHRRRGPRVARGICLLSQIRTIIKIKKRTTNREDTAMKRRALLATLPVFALALLVVVSGCAPRLLAPNELAAPEPILDNTGKYMSPYTQDDVMAEWTDKALAAKTGAAVGRLAGQYAGQKAMEQVPLVGGILGEKVGGAIGRKIAIEAAGGMEFIVETSDVSFNDIDDMAVYLYVKHSSHEYYKEALDAAMEIYPPLKKRYGQALIKASRQARK